EVDRGEADVHVRVDEAREDGVPPRIDDLIVGAGDASARCDDHAVLDRNVSISDGGACAVEHLAALKYLPSHCRSSSLRNDRLTICYIAERNSTMAAES